MIIEKSGDLLESDAKIICHQVNCLGLFGAGIAKQIALKWPNVNQRYKETCKKVSSSDRRRLLGKVLFVKTPDNKIIANLFAQESVGTDRVRTEYDMLKKCLKIVEKYGADNGYPSIGIPNGIGCGLGGGRWETVKGIIDETFKDYKGGVYIVKFE